MNKFTQQKFQAYIAGVAQDNGEDVAFVAMAGNSPSNQQSNKSLKMQCLKAPIS